MPGQRSGQPCIRGFRVTVWDVLDMRASGMTEDQILGDYPYLEKADFPAVYAYASQNSGGRASHMLATLPDGPFDARVPPPFNNSPNKSTSSLLL
jgi:uncharacterized protein (DUF433 family)